jgi:sigma-B regulation protein RsbU (phosphoserine phosphatase)
MNLDARHAPCGLLSLSAEATILDANATLGSMLGRAPEDLVGLRLDAILAPGGKVFVQTHLLPLLLLHGRVDEIFLSLRHAELGTVPVLLTAVRRGDALAAPIDCALMLVRNRARFEDELLAARASAERAGHELRRSNAELERFAATAAHDLREPLRKVSVFASRLRHRLGDALDAESQHQFERLADATVRMQAMVDGLLELARAGGQPLRIQAVALDTIAPLVLADLGPAIAAADAQVDCSALPRVLGDPVLLQQIMQNLVGNAIKFQRAGVAPRIRIDGGVLGSGEAWFRVHDNGRGFARTDVARLFRPFERLQENPSPPGSGLGLAAVQRLVEALAGTITADGEPGVGAVFTVTLPAAPPP